MIYKILHRKLKFDNQKRKSRDTQFNGHKKGDKMTNNLQNTTYVYVVYVANVSMMYFYA